MQAYLRVTAGPDSGRKFDLTEGLNLTISRGEKSDTKLTDGSVSRLDCTVKWEGGKFLLSDLESVGGTFVDGKKVSEHALKHDEEFQIAATRLKLHTSGIADAATLLAAFMFIRAMTTANELKHPNLIALYAAGKEEGKCWFAMEFVDGEPLTKLIEGITV